MDVEVALIFCDPNGKFVRNIPRIADRRDQYVQEGLLVKEDGHYRWTRRGRVLHYIATEVNPRRGAYRTAAKLTAYMVWFGGGVTDIVKVGKEVSEHLSALQNLGMIEPDTNYFKAPAWRLC